MKNGAKMAALQGKNPKMDPKNVFFLEKGPFFELLKQVPESSHQTRHFGQNQYIGNYVLKCLPAQCDLLASSIALQVTQPWLEIPLGVCRSLA